jgi:hypothetical protein
VLAILQFIFSSFWIWLGSVILLSCGVGSLGGLFRFTIKPIVKEKKEVSNV